MSESRPNELIVSWNACGRRLVVDADRLAVEHDRAHRQRARPVDDPGQPVGDVVEVARVDPHVVADAGAPGCARRRASTRPTPCRRRRARCATSGAPAASIGRTPRPTSSPTPRSPGGALGERDHGDVRRGRPTASRPGARAPPAPTRRARRRRPSGPRARPGAARRRAGAGGSRPPPAVARPNSVAQDRAGDRRPNRCPVVAWIWSSARSTSAIVSVGTAAGVTSSRNTVAQPTPMRPWRGSPVRNPTAASISSGASRPSSSASAATFVERARVDATASEVATTSASNTAPVCPIEVSLRARAARAARVSGRATPCGRHRRGRSRPTRRSPRRRRARAAAPRPTSSSPTMHASAERSSPPIRRMRA